MAHPCTFTGVYPILPTPFRDDDSLDFESLVRIIRFMGEVGVQGVTVIGVLGESNRLLDRERAELIQVAVEAAPAGLAVIVGVSHGGTGAALELARMAESLGADGVMVAPLKEAVPSDDRVFEYFRRIADGIGIPIVAQDHPASTEVHMSVPLLLRLVEEIPRIACLKEEAPPTPTRIGALVEGMKQRRVPVLTGLGALYGLFDLERGSSGFNTGFAFPEVLLAITRAAQGGDWQRANELFTRFLPLIVFEQQPGVAIRKELFRLRGLIDSARVRHPGAGITPAAAAQLRAVVERTLPGIDITRPLAL